MKIYHIIILFKALRNGKKKVHKNECIKIKINEWHTLVFFCDVHCKDAKKEVVNKSKWNIPSNRLWPATLRGSELIH